MVSQSPDLLPEDQPVSVEPENEDLGAGILVGGIMEEEQSIEEEDQQMGEEPDRKRVKLQGEEQRDLGP